MSANASRLRRGSYGVIGCLCSVITCALIAVPVVTAAPQQPCNQTFGDSVDSYLNEHPDVKQELTARAQQESPGSPNALLDYLNRHPDVRQALITLSQQCVS